MVEFLSCRCLNDDEIKVVSPGATVKHPERDV